MAVPVFAVPGQATLQITRGLAAAADAAAEACMLLEAIRCIMPSDQQLCFNIDVRRTSKQGCDMLMLRTAPHSKRWPKVVSSALFKARPSYPNPEP